MRAAASGRVTENIKAVNAKALLFRFGPFPWRSALSIILEALKPIIYSLEEGYTVLADSFQTGQLWIVDLSDGKYGVKLDCHRRSFTGWEGSEGPAAESEKFWSYLRYPSVADDSVQEVTTVIIRVASALYELIAGKCPPARGLADAPVSPNMVPIEQPQLAALILDCLADPQAAPKTLEELRSRLWQIYNNPAAS